MVSKNHPKADSRGCILYHRMIVEQKLKRYLSTDEEVHHIDENKDNNNVNNLQVMSSLEHFEHHRVNRVIKKVLLRCPVCNKEFVKENRGYKSLMKKRISYFSAHKNVVRSLYVIQKTLKKQE